MKKIMLCSAIFILLWFSCSFVNHVPQMAPAASKNIVIEAMRLYNGKLFILKSEIVPGNYYYNTATRDPQRRRVWLEIYIADRGHIVLWSIKEAKYIPAKPEMWEFEKEN